jgi:cephalosporin-C deacetylase-like acetyl esterase
MKLKLFAVLVVTLPLLAIATANAQTTASNFTEREVTFAGGGGLPLHGTLLLPAGVKRKVPGVLLLPGSGPSDR